MAASSLASTTSAKTATSERSARRRRIGKQRGAKLSPLKRPVDRQATTLATGTDGYRGSRFERLSGKSVSGTPPAARV